MNSYLLGLCTIDKWIEEWRDQQVQARKQDMDIGGNIRTKPVCEEGEEGQEVELEEDTDVRDASTECFQPSLLLRQMKNSDKYLYIGQCDECEVKASHSEGHKQAIDFIDVDIFLGQFHNGHMHTVRMGDDRCKINLKPALYQRNAWGRKNGCPECYHSPYLGD